MFTISGMPSLSLLNSIYQVDQHRLLVDINGKLCVKYLEQTRKLSTYSSLWETDPDLRLLHDRTFRRHTIKPHDFYNIDWYRFPAGEKLTLGFLPSTSTKSMYFKGRFTDIEEFLDNYQSEIVFYRINYEQIYFSWTKLESEKREWEAYCLEIKLDEGI